MDEYSIKVLSWIGISLVFTYRKYFMKPHNFASDVCNRNEEEDILSWIRENKKQLTESIRHDTATLINWIRGNDEKLTEWIREDQETSTWSNESIRFKMVSWIRMSSMVTYRIIVLSKIPGDKEILLEWIRKNEDKLTVCSILDKQKLTEWIRENKETLTKSIRKDAITCIEMIRESEEMLAKRIKTDKEMCIERFGLPTTDTYRHYFIFLSDTISSSQTSTAWLEREQATMTELTTDTRELFQPGCPSAFNITSTTIALVWDEPLVGAHCYEIKCEQKNISSVCYYITSGNSCKYVVKDLSPNSEYNFTIRAIKNEVNKGPYSNTLNVSTSVISYNSITELSYVLFYIVVFIWFTYLLCYTVFIE